MQHSITGRLALVTGASSGIGKAFAQRLAAEGFSVVLVARNQAQLVAVEASLPKRPHTVLCADLITARGIADVTTFLAENHVEILVNNAGVGSYGNFHETDCERLSHLVQLNCTAVVEVAHAFLRQARDGDALINVSSVLGVFPQPTSAVYAASKAFLTSLSESLWYENRCRGIYVMGLHPGITRTEFRERAGGGRAYERGSQSPEDVAAAAWSALRGRTHPTIVSGTKNAILFAIPRFLGRKFLASWLGKTRSYTHPNPTKAEA